MVVVVTGGSGFIGSHIVDKLIEIGYSVRVIDLMKPHRSDVEFADVDILDPERVKEATKDAEFIFHLAAMSNVNEAFEKPLLTVNLNTVATVNILEAARLHDIKRVLFASTVWIYSGASGENIDENSAFYISGAGHIYTSTKIAAEFYFHNYWELYKVPFTILRYGIPYGPRARRGTVVPIFVDKALRGENLVIFGDGKQYRNFLYVEDLAEGNILALKDIAKNQTYNLEGLRPISVKEVAETVKKLLGGTIEIEYKPGRPGDYGGKVVISEKARKELGWYPKIDFEDGMKRYIDWYKKSILK